jgi:hypothetical protein
MENDNLTPEQSLALINQMITGVKKELKDNGFFFLLWGWLVFVSAMSNFILLKMQSEYAFYVWPILMPLGGIISAIYGFTRLKRKEKRVKTFVDRAMGYVWISFGAALCIVLSSSSQLGFEKIYPFVLLIYGIGTFITGGIIKMKLLIWGGIFCWILSIVAFYVNFEAQLILLAAAIAVAYIIPGHVINANYRKHV